MPDRNYFAHESAYVDDGCRIGQDTKIWHFTHVMAGATIGDRCNLGQNVVVSSTAIIGNNCKIQNNVSIYDNVTLEDDVFCGPSMVFTNVYNPRSHVPRKNEYRDTLVKRGATLGANSTIVCGITIGEFAFVAAGALVNRNVKAYALMAGVPARQIGWMSEHGERIDVPLAGAGSAICPATGQRYELTSGILRRVTA
jgi:UDP-2-acetamido-3-amino-2,3-dideoxy-glucuronate N-acetyltransferase